jgi:hypothetical protein
MTGDYGRRGATGPVVSRDTEDDPGRMESQHRQRDCVPSGEAGPFTSPMADRPRGYPLTGETAGLMPGAAANVHPIPD